MQVAFTLNILAKDTRTIDEMMLKLLIFPSIIKIVVITEKERNLQILKIKNLILAMMMFLSSTFCEAVGKWTHLGSDWIL